MICASCHCRKALCTIRQGNAIAILCGSCYSLLGALAPKAQDLPAKRKAPCSSRKSHWPYT